MTIQDDRKMFMAPAAVMVLTAGMALPDMDPFATRSTMRCPNCARPFKTADALKRHVETKHKERAA